MTTPEFIMLDLGMVFEEQSGTAAFECLDDVFWRDGWLFGQPFFWSVWRVDRDGSDAVFQFDITFDLSLDDSARLDSQARLHLI